ncbi:hypothetical protein SERLADRAFT_377608, partial [Serpula lacrymans var. lacrymans S7.9]
MLTGKEVGTLMRCGRVVSGGRCIWEYSCAPHVFPALMSRLASPAQLGKVRTI